MNLKFVVGNLSRFLFMLVSISLVTVLAQYFIYTPEKTELAWKWCLYTGILFGALESAGVFITNDETSKVFKGIIPNNAKKVSFLKYVWFRFRNGI